jgi:hypothetical protein
MSVGGAGTIGPLAGADARCEYDASERSVWWRRFDGTDRFRLTGTSAFNHGPARQPIDPGGDQARGGAKSCVERNVQEGACMPNAGNSIDP